MDPFIYPLAFIIILSILVFVHELGHFVVAKWAGITVEEFAIGFPPRAVKLWQDEGSITLDGHEFVIGRNINVPRSIQPGAQVYAETGIDAKGRPAVTKLEWVGLPQGQKEEKSGSEARLFNVFSRSNKAVTPDNRPTVTVDAVTRPTEYSLNWIPFGGYVRMVGEEDPTAPGSFASKSKKARFAVLAAGSLMNLVAAVLFFTLTSMSGVPQTRVGTFVANVMPDSPASQARLQPGDLITGADDTQFSYEGDLVNYIETKKGSEVTLHIERNGQPVEAMVTPRNNPPQGQGALGIVIQPAKVALTTKIAEITPDGPAAKAGLQEGDHLLAVDDSELKYENDLLKYVEQTNGAVMTLRYSRNNEEKTATLTPVAQATTPEGKLGLTLVHDLDSKLMYYPFGTALSRGLVDTARYVGLTFYVPIAIFQRVLPLEAARPTGPVGIYQQTGSVVEAAISLNWWFPVLWWMAILSTALAVTNLLPLPALDGGRILFVIIEAIRGKRVAPEKEGAIHFIGLAFLLTLMLVISYYDISSPIQGIDWFSLF
ncbi:MAG: RIP metalloprotease RseP [Anaerolineae bacterium]